MIIFLHTIEPQSGLHPQQPAQVCSGTHSIAAYHATFCLSGRILDCETKIKSPTFNKFVRTRIQLNVGRYETNVVEFLSLLIHDCH